MRKMIFHIMEGSTFSIDGVSKEDSETILNTLSSRKDLSILTQTNKRVYIPYDKVAFVEEVDDA